MRSSQFTKLVVGGLLSSLIAVSTKAYADTPAAAPTAKWYDTVGFSGYLQGSFVGNLNSPKSGTNAGRQFDTSSNSFNLNTFLLQIAKPVGESDHYGFTVRVRTGKDASALNFASLDSAAAGSTGAIALQEAYATYAIPSLTTLQIVAGKFVTSEGFESIDSVNNPNFSEGLLFTFAEPLTHTGLKANYTISDKANATIGLVNGWDVTSDNNEGKTILWQVATSPTKQITWSFQGLYGKELTRNQGIALADHSQRLSLDTVLGFNPTDKISLNLQGNWGQQTHDATVVANGGTDPGTTHWVGAGLWASYACTSTMSEVLRFEVLNDQNNANRFGTGNGSGAFSGPQTVKEFTLTHKTMLTASLGNRVEFRHDWSNKPYFERQDGSSVRNQNTLSTDFFVTF